MSERVLGDDGHRVDPVDHEPELWKAAREITAEYSGAFTVDARFGFLRADWSPGVLPEGEMATHYEALTGDELRLKLDRAVRERQQESAVETGSGR